MTIREGVMDVRVLNESGRIDPNEHRLIEEAVAAQLASTGERLVRLLGDHWTGYADGPTSPYMVYYNLAYEATPIN